MQAPDDSWAEYTHVYMAAIRKKFYAAHDKPGGKAPAKLKEPGETAGEAVIMPAPLLVREDTAFISPAERQPASSVCSGLSANKGQHLQHGSAMAARICLSAVLGSR